MMTTVQEGAHMLICEGRCNPYIGEVDSAIQRAMRGMRQPPIGDDVLYDRVKALRYTAHVEVNGWLYRCLACGHERRWGN